MMVTNKKKGSSIKEGLADLAQVAEQDHEVQMARAELYKLAKYSIKLHEMLKNISEQEGLEGWVQSKITKAADYIGSVYHHLDYDVKFQQDVVSEGKCNCNCGKAICESCGKPHKKKKVKEDAKEKFEPHMMYDPKTGESKHAKVEKDHLDMKAKGWSHDKPKAKDIKVKEGDGIYHDCAKKFEHKTYGECTVIPGEHTLLEDGTVTHYDATFTSCGQRYVVRNVPTTSMTNVISEGHTHASKPKTKKK
jgi:hypothetical protein